MPWQAAWRAWLACLFGAVAISAIAALAAGDARETILGYLHIVLSTYAGEDSWLPMRAASLHLAAQPEVPVYDAVFFRDHVKFQYPLTAMLLLDLPQRWFGVGLEQVIAALKLLSRLCLPLIGVVFYQLFMGSVPGAHGAGSAPPPRQGRAVLVALGVVSALLFYPLVRSEYHGQIQTAMTLAAALALLAWQRGRPVLAGVLIALCCAVKPQWGLLVLWGLTRREWRFAASAALTGAAFLALALVFYGFANVFNYLPVLDFLSRHGESYFINQSVNGLMHRLLFNGVNLQGAGQVWSGTDFPPYDALVYAATTVSSALLLLAALLWRIGRPATAVEMALVMATLTIASPIAWDHHYAVLLPIWAVVFPQAVQARPWGRATQPLLWLAVALSSQCFIAPTHPLAATHWNWLQSYQLFGGLLVLDLLYRMSVQAQHVRAGNDPPARRASAAA